MSDQEPDGAAPLDADEAAELLPSHIATREELNAWEQLNILEAIKWTSNRRPDPLLESTVRTLHRRMFDRTWVWAGTYRRSDKSLGVPWFSIPAEVLKLLKDGQYWLSHDTYPIDEAALRLHHRMVWVHPFPNGNGRHSRLWCDLVLQANGRPPIQWRNAELDLPGGARRAYIDALRAADEFDFEPLFSLYLATGRPG
jgi:Fic-DOC domain mobile mystery protein B